MDLNDTEQAVVVVSAKKNAGWVVAETVQKRHERSQGT